MSFWYLGSHPLSAEIFSLTAEIYGESYFSIAGSDRRQSGSEGRSAGAASGGGMVAYQVGGLDFEGEFLLLEILRKTVVSFWASRRLDIVSRLGGSGTECL